MMQRYKDHTVILSAGSDENTGKFTPVASIAWETHDGIHAEHSFTSPERCITRLYAIAVAFDEAKSWIDRRLNHS